MNGGRTPDLEASGGEEGCESKWNRETDDDKSNTERNMVVAIVAVAAVVLFGVS